LGKVAVENILPEYKARPMSELRGRIFWKDPIRYFPMLHPAAILHAQRNPELEATYKQQTWNDIQNLKRYLEEGKLI
jgi:uracil-DNA glycosylase